MKFALSEVFCHNRRPSLGTLDSLGRSRVGFGLSCNSDVLLGKRMTVVRTLRYYPLNSHLVF